MTVGFPIIAIIVILAAVFLARQPDPQKRARILRQAGFGMTALTTAFFGLFVVGETFTDPGGWEALGLVAAWAVPSARSSASSSPLRSRCSACSGQRWSGCCWSWASSRWSCPDWGVS